MEYAMREVGWCAGSEWIRSGIHRARLKTACSGRRCAPPLMLTVRRRAVRHRIHVRESDLNRSVTNDSIHDL